MKRYNPNFFYLHYEEYDEQDYAIDITADVMVRYFQHLKYSRSKANLIVSGLQSLALVGDMGFLVLIEEDGHFYDWAKEEYRARAAEALGFGEYLLVYLDEDMEYQEETISGWSETHKRFDKLKRKNLPVAIVERNRQFKGWRSNPIRSSQWPKLRWRFERNHTRRIN